MDLIFNEQSLNPVAESEHVLQQRIKTAIDTYNTLKTKYGFKHIRFQSNFQELKGTEDKSLYDCICNISNRTLQSLSLGLFKKPFVDDLKDDELLEYLSSDFKLQMSSKVTVFGLAIAYIQSLPTLSFISDTTWETNKIIIYKSQTGSQPLTVYNAFSTKCSNSDDINEWAEIFFYNDITTKESLTRFLNFSTYNSVITDNFFDQIMDWKTKDLKTYNNILALMKDADIHPFTSGLGKTEVLSHRQNEASKRINLADRLSYTIESGIITFLSCRGHYDHH